MKKQNSSPYNSIMLAEAVRSVQEMKPTQVIGDDILSTISSPLH